MTGALQGKVAFVTGAASGLGLGIVSRFVAEGAQVIAADIQEADALATLAPQVLFRHCDVRDAEAIRTTIDAGVAHFGGLDILVNNAGGPGASDRIDTIDAAAFDDTIVLLLRSVVMGTRHAAPHLRARGGGAIINMSSAGGLTPGSTRFAYATAKAAVIHFTKETALQLAKDNIRANAVAPGFIPTPHSARVFAGAGGGDAMAAAQDAAPTIQPLPRGGTVADVAEACLYLASDAGRFVSGIVLPVDGAASAGRYTQ